MVDRSSRAVAERYMYRHDPQEPEQALRCTACTTRALRWAVSMYITPQAAIVAGLADTATPPPLRRFFSVS